MLAIVKGIPTACSRSFGTGHITAADYRDVLVPEVKARLARRKTLRMLYQLGPAYKAFGAGAAWPDMKLGAAHWTAFDRIAVVTDVGWIREAVRILAPFFHHPLRIFPNAEGEAARTWIIAEESPDELDTVKDRIIVEQNIAAKLALALALRASHR